MSRDVLLWTSCLSRNGLKVCASMFYVWVLDDEDVAKNVAFVCRKKSHVYWRIMVSLSNRQVCFVFRCLFYFYYILQAGIHEFLQSSIVSILQALTWWNINLNWWIMLKIRMPLWNWSIVQSTTDFQAVFSIVSIYPESESFKLTAQTGGHNTCLFYASLKRSEQCLDTINFNANEASFPFGR